MVETRVVWPSLCHLSARWRVSESSVDFSDEYGLAQLSLSLCTQLESLSLWGGARCWNTSPLSSRPLCVAAARRINGWIGALIVCSDLLCVVRLDMLGHECAGCVWGLALVEVLGPDRTHGQVCVCACVRVMPQRHDDAHSLSD